MKRKVIQHSPTSIVITLPKKWADKKYIKKGDELDIIERGDELVIVKEKIIVEPKEIDIDITKLDKTTALHVIRNLYRDGYDKIILRFMKNQLPYSGEQIPSTVSQITHRELRRLIGYEITREQSNSCIIENISEGATEGIATIIRRIYMLLIDIADSLYEGTKKNDKIILHSIKHKHETIVRFINYCLRTGTKKDVDQSISYSEYYCLATLDRIVRLLSSCSKRLIKLETSPPKVLMEVLKRTVETFRLFHKFKYTNKSTIINEMNQLRYEIDELIEHKPKNTCNLVNHALYQNRLIHHLFLDICDVKGV